jgi:hypothetical protein
MMTRTSGPDYAADGIYMTSVDTGWVTDGACFITKAILLLLLLLLFNFTLINY